ncbi:SDR family oxidoreductase [Alkalicaulis satelles]|uniref:SDR family oxidoreductase n=1 Tax=Alkalicaulis satelles TaxID=2609175 RepID=A0A5M6ZMK6_9PROT|nr:SDR family oxidoreductase [Alkalicaulis satelles]KAA5804884.1 SDR family oxidoreductase [Alkalicaulis satelles]
MSAAVKKPEGAALVTGAARRIGRALAEALAEDGYALAVHYNTSREEAEAFAQAIRDAGGRAEALGADLSDPDAAGGLIDAARAALGPVSVLVNSASIFEDDGFDTISADSFRRHMDANTLAPALLSRAFAAQAPEGSMIFNLLDYKLFNINADFFSYTLSKAALMTMTQMLARALAPRVRVNAAAPGLTLPSPYHSVEQFERLHHDNPLTRGPTPDDLVRTLRYFLNTPSVSGQIVCVDGGQHFDPRLTRDVFGAL